MRDAVVCEPVRTPVGRYGGMLKPLRAAELGAVALQGLILRSGIDPELIEDVILGHGYANSDAPAIGRVVGLDAGLPIGVPGYHVDRRCGSGLQAVVNAAMQVQTGVNDVVVAGGVESMSNAAVYSTDIRWGTGAETTLHDSLVRSRSTAGGRLHPVSGGMLETAENLRRQYQISRAEQDELAVMSHARAVRARDDGTLAEEIVEVTVPQRRGPAVVVAVDEHPRADTTFEALARLRPIRLAEDPDATVTAGNSSGQNDAAAMCLVTTPQRADELGLRPLVRLVGWAGAGVAPELMGIGPVPATERVLQRVGLGLADLDLIELNEAFAAQAIAVMREWKFAPGDLERTNVHGSGISLGHPVGATGVRMLATLARELHRRDGRYGLVTMCIGGGQGLAAVFERVS